MYRFLIKYHTSHSDQGTVRTFDIQGNGQNSKHRFFSYTSVGHVGVCRI